MKKNISKILTFVLLIMSSIIVKSQDSLDDVFKCYCVDGEICVSYRNPNLFEDKNYADTLKTDYIKIYFPNLVKDTLEVFIDNMMIARYFNSVIDDPENHFFYDHSSCDKPPILTVRPINKDNACLQLVIDNRYRLMFISQGEQNWYVTYSNFQVSTE